MVRKRRCFGIDQGTRRKRWVADAEKISREAGADPAAVAEVVGDPVVVEISSTSLALRIVEIVWKTVGTAWRIAGTWPRTVARSSRSVCKG